MYHYLISIRQKMMIKLLLQDLHQPQIFKSISIGMVFAITIFINTAALSCRIKKGMSK